MKKTVLYFALAVFTSFVACKENDNRTELEKKTEKLGDAAADLAKETGKTIEEKSGDAKEAIAEMGSDLKAAREQTKKDIQKGIDEINDNIQKMDAKMEKAAEKQKAAWKKQKESLIVSRDRLSSQLKDVGSDMKEGWNAFEADVKTTLKNVKKNLEQ